MNITDRRSMRLIYISEKYSVSFDGYHFYELARSVSYVFFFHSKAISNCHQAKLASWFTKICICELRMSFFFIDLCCKKIS